MTLARFLFCGLLLLASWSQSSARTVELLDAAESSETLRESLAVLAEFYGLTYRHTPFSTPQAALQRFRSPDVSAVVVTPAALAQLPKPALVNILQAKRLPLLIAGVRQQDCGALELWLATRIQCASVNIDGEAVPFTVADSPVASELGGEELRLRFAGTVFGFKPGGDLKPLIYRESQPLSSTLFLQATGRELQVFVLGEILPHPAEGKHSPLVESFAPLAGYAMFLRHAAGDYAWHPPEYLANFTIDDPWLREPYGALSYRQLLEEMEKHNFHTTIAFIPWNFDRSQQEVVALMRDNPKRYSIAMHGNNHDHIFERTAATDKQESDIRQAIARMERFHSLTGLPYDRVMVFPRKIAPSATLALLKQHNFLATVNARHVPLDEAMPKEPSFFLSAATIRYQNFPSLRRYSVEGEMSRESLAVEAFLGNPLVFYGHHQLFQGGIGNFNRIANMVAKIQPATNWVSLGEIARHLYKLRQRSDGSFDVLAFSSEITLKNPTSRERRFHVTKPENFDPGKSQLLVDGEPHPASHAGEKVSFTVVVPPGKQRTASIRYLGAGNALSQPVEGSGFTIGLRRRLSDFRDVTLSQSTWGRELLRFYYTGGTAERVSAILLVIGIALASLLLLRRWFAAYKTQRKRMASRVA
jgi:hypothetical protein